MVFYGKPSSLNGKAAVKNHPNNPWFLACSRFSTFAKKKHVPTAMKVYGEETRAHHKKAHVITT